MSAGVIQEIDVEYDKKKGNLEKDEGKSDSTALNWSILLFILPVDEGNLILG